jgi:hypothetical protein
MAKTFDVNGKSVTTDEDWYEIDAFGKRLGPRHFNAGQQGPAAPPPVTTAGGGGGGVVAPPPNAGLGTPPPSLGGIDAMAGGAGGAGGAIDLPTPGMMKPLGQRIRPQDSMALVGLGRVY